MSEKLVSSQKAVAVEYVSFRIMRLLETHPDISQRDLATHVDISLRSLSYCLRPLMERGLVKLENFHDSMHKFKYAYILMPAGISQKIAMTGRFLNRKIKECEALKAKIESLKSDLVKAGVMVLAKFPSLT